jgi:hypothetical protein
VLNKTDLKRAANILIKGIEEYLKLM